MKGKKIKTSTGTVPVHIKAKIRNRNLPYPDKKKTLKEKHPFSKQIVSDTQH
jgi:hypothetical protein